ncbi:hypothetical protein K440DRAFT_664454 [Wilcoxina mikolae CBS 423.85]|nr:hypothetical protein K440DRAFT_664454 [Wilcoxina mikolae CBS 423.85]
MQFLSIANTLSDSPTGRSFSIDTTLHESYEQPSRGTPSEKDRRYSLDQRIDQLHLSPPPHGQYETSPPSIGSFSSVSHYSQDNRMDSGIAADDLEFPGCEPGELNTDAPGDLLPRECEGCDTKEDLSWCHICDVTVCNDCWGRQAAHGSGRKQQTRGNHEQTELGLRDIINWILRPNNDKDTDGRHAMDYITKWFGVSIQPGDEGDVSLQTTPRYRELSVGGGVTQNQYPALISFVGETGAGKSTLISALMKIGGLDDQSQDNNQPVRTPVIGNLSDLDTPTSSDVHLFPDPATRNSDRPLLFADCEGLDGGNKLPIAARAVLRIGKFGTNLKGKRFQELRIKWATGEKRSRGWMVKKFYPRILFTFSDVVCYVTKNFRTMEVVISRLIRWANAVFQTSVNQPLLPYAIIIVNALEDKGVQDNSGWWEDDPTIAQLDKHTDSFKDDPFLEGLARQWRVRGKEIHTLKDLISCYYCGIKIICVPHMNAAPSRISTQYRKLQGLIKDASMETYKMRCNAELLMNSEELDIYFSYAFNHFSQNPTKPFDFLNAAFQHSPIEATFKYHILKAATRLMETGQFESDCKLFDELAPLVASSILLDVCRKGYPLRSIHVPVLLAAAAVEMVSKYERFCYAAQEEFYQHHWPCNYRDRKGRRCVNVATKHQKGHQISTGKVVAAGTYIPEREGLEADGFHFIELVTKTYKELIEQLNQKQKARLAAIQIQKDTLGKDPYLKMWNNPGTAPSKAYSSHSTCFSCLFSAPHHALSCGHVICDMCVEDFSELPHVDHLRTVTECPLCATGLPPWEKLLVIKKNPRQAGPRILSLDGGGVRSIMQLQILSILEERIGLGIPIGEFFDLIIGTSAGGIIALGLGERRMSIEECLEMFCSFARKAFTKRTGAGIRGIGYLVEAQHHSQYESKGLNQSLKLSFGEKKMFGEATVSSESAPIKPVKVGVTMTSSSGRPYLTTNYNRATRKINAGYEFLRAEDHTREMKVWEAARATSAAPRFFKPFYHEESGNIFSDGALTFNNPIEIAEYERKMLWPDHMHPDILLSIGTGGEPKEEFELGSDLRDPISQKGLVGYLKRLKAIVAHQNKHVMNSELAWENFRGRKNLEKLEDQAYLRLNMELLDRIPRIDQVEDLDFLIGEATKYAEDNEVMINNTVTKLIASLFYLRLDEATPDRHDNVQQQHCKATIFCRLDAKSLPLRNLCERIRESNYLFSIKTGPDKTYRLDSNSSPLLNEDGMFELKIEFSVPTITEPIRIYLTCRRRAEPDTGQLISGFPCSLDQLRKLSKPMMHYS